ncbi:DUF262 domain-containing protein [Brevibacterium sp. K72]|uniref:DUF262 domain-containing protein n=1 Tax=Brevibacterium sp. K72 TaxID=3390729 RepID=UPI003D2FBFD8
MSDATLKFEIESKTVAEFRKLQNDGELELRPDYQRKLVWPEHAKVSLMETILLGYPIPEIYLAYETSADGDVRASVVDGQQRLTALLQFVNNEYPLQGLEDEGLIGQYEGLFFKDLPPEVRQDFFEYRFPIRRLSNITDEFVRSVFARVNRVNMVLTEQELRNAIMPGPFLEFLKDCSYHKISTVSGIFSPQRRQRGGDLEFFAEAFGSCVFGLSNKKAELDERYDTMSVDFEDYADDAMSFVKLLDDLTILIKWEGRTRWSNIVDMFTLLHVTWEFREGLNDLTSDPSSIRDFFDLFQRSVSHYKKNGGDESATAADLKKLGVLAGVENDRVESAIAQYTSGVRNSSDLGARRSRSSALSGLLNNMLS